MKTRIIIFLIILALIFPVAGCFKKVTVQSLLEDAAKKLEDAESFQMDAKLEVDVEIEIETMSVGILAEAEATGKITGDTAHLEGNLSYSAMGEKEKIDFEAYLVQEKDEMTAYADMGEGWSKSGIDEDDDDFDDAKKLMDGLKLYKMVEQLVEYADDLELSKKTEKVGKIDAYVIEGKVSGEFIIDYLKSLDIEEIEEQIEDMLDQGDVDLEDYEVDIKLLIDKKTKLPVLLEIDFADIVGKVVDQMLGGMMAPIMSYDGEDENEDDDDDEELSPSTSVKTCMLEIEFSSYNDVKTVKVPKDVMSEAEENDDYIDSIDNAQDILDDLW